MAPISLQLNVMYAKDLTSFNFFQNLLVYVLVSIESDDKKPNHINKHQLRTPTDVDGDGNPEWNQKMCFDISNHVSDHGRLFLHFDLRHERQYFGDKTIGEVRVPIKDLMEEEVGSNGATRFVSYQVLSPDGKPNGLLHFSCKFVDATTSSIHQQSNSDAEYIRYPISEVESYPPIQVSEHHDITYDPYSSCPASFASYYPQPTSLPLFPLPPPPPLLHQLLPTPPGIYSGYYQPPYPPVFHQGIQPGVHHD